MAEATRPCRISLFLHKGTHLDSRIFGRRKVVGMLKIIRLSLVLFLFAGCSGVKPPSAEKSEDNQFTVVFYNVENLFDTEDDPANKGDDEWLPESENQWTPERYEKKLTDLAKVLSAISNGLPIIIGLCEVENHRVVADLAARDALAKGKYGIIHRESPDSRGIDVALLYRRALFAPDSFAFHTVTLPNPDRPTTRDILYARGNLKGHRLHMFVNHWPSRSGGQEQSEPNRMEAARVLKSKMDSILVIEPDARILAMGDFNDYPNNRSLNEGLRAKGVKPSHYYNFMERMAKDGLGTYFYKGEWGVLDQFIGSWPLVESTTGLTATSDAAGIFKEDWILHVSKEGVASPSRTFGGPNYYGGYSDHLPIYIHLTVKP
jgi:hypothetical protein